MLLCHSLLNETTQSSDEERGNSLLEDSSWPSWCMKKLLKIQDNARHSPRDVLPTDVVINNALTDEDLDDSECLEESLNDIRILAAKFGEVNSIRIEDRSVVVVYSGGLVEAQKSVAELCKVIIGGEQLTASIKGVDNIERVACAVDKEHFVELRNILTVDDLEDEECLRESINDITELAQQFGTVLDVSVENGVTDTAKDVEPNSNCLLIHFSSPSEAEKAVVGFNGMIVGGHEIAASYVNSCPSTQLSNVSLSEQTNAQVLNPMLSGDKVIPERFAECKRVPKIPNRSPIRQYASQIDDESVKPLLVEMLGELMRLQRRAVEENNTKARRRIVMGLREVARGIRAKKVKLVVMANNLDEYGVIDEKCQEIISLAHTEDIPIFYEFSKKALGKALGKSLKVGVVGVQNADGANQQFKKLAKLASMMPIKPLNPVT